MDALALSAQPVRTGISFQYFPHGHSSVAGVSGVWQLADGSMLVAGVSDNDTSTNVLYKLTPEGQLDTRFAAGASVPGILNVAELTLDTDQLIPELEFVDVGADGSIWVLFRSDSEQGVALARLSADGQLDTRFHALGPEPGLLDLMGVNFWDIKSVYAQPDGSLHLSTVGWSQVDGGWRQQVQVLSVDAQGQLKPELSIPVGNHLIATQEEILYHPLHAQIISYHEDGSMLVQVWDSAAQTIVLARVDAQGHLDASFNGDSSTPGMLAPVGLYNRWTELPDGKLMQITVPSYELPELVLTRLNSDGSVDASFSAAQALRLLGSGATLYSPNVHVLPLENGKYIVTASEGGSALLLRLNADGSLDTSFNAAGPDPGLARVAFDPRFELDLHVQALEGGSLMLTGTQYYFNFSARVKADGTLDTSYGALPDAPHPSVDGDVLPAPDTGVIAGSLGLDWADFSGTFAEHRVSLSPPAAWHWPGEAFAVDAQDEGTPVWAASVERLRFEDLTLALDTEFFLDLESVGTLWPAQYWDHAGNTAVIVALLWGAEALQDTRLVGEVLAYVDTLGYASTVQRLMDAPEAFGIQGAADPAQWLQNMYTNLMGREASPAHLQQMLEVAGTAPTHLALFFTALSPDASSPSQAQVLRDLLLPFGEWQHGLLHQEFSGPILGTEQNDRFVSRAVNDIIDGGAGLDEVVYSRPASSHTVERLDDGTLQVQGPGDTVDLLWNVERLRFGDIYRAFDLAEGQSANQAARVITALAGSDTLDDQSIVRTAVEHIDELGFEAATALLVDSGIAASYAGGANIEHLVSTLYGNVVGANGTAEELQWYQTYVAQVGWSAVEVLRFAAEHPLTAQRMDLDKLTEEGLAYTAPSYNVFYPEFSFG